jgi:hypothetical protein
VLVGCDQQRAEGEFEDQYDLQRRGRDSAFERTGSLFAIVPIIVLVLGGFRASAVWHPARRCSSTDTGTDHFFICFNVVLFPPGPLQQSPIRRAISFHDQKR